jgi:hypothetical protein
MITLLTSCATARRRRGAGKARSLDTSAATRDMQGESRHAMPAKRDHVRMLEDSSA